MNNTKTIFKSLLIMIVAISLFTVSCSKDEGGTKKPTNPTIEKISANQITSILTGLGELKGTGPDANTVMLNLNSVNPSNVEANIIKEGTEGKNLQKVKDAITTAFETPLTPVSVKLTLDDAAKVGNTTDLKATIVFTAKSGYEFDESITGTSANAYVYNKDAKTATLTLNIKLPQSASWEQ